MTQGEWTGHQSRKARAKWKPLIATGNIDCYRCGQPIQPNQQWDIDHIQTRHDAPHLTDTPDNQHPSHRSCNTRAGGKLGAAIRHGQTPKPAGKSRAVTKTTGRDRGGRRQTGSNMTDSGLSVTQGNPRSLTHAAVYPEEAQIALPRPVKGPRSGELVGGGVLIPPTIPSPLWASEPHPRAVGTYADQALEWIRERRLADDLVPDGEKEPHPMWRAVLGRALEHDADGRLVWRVVVLSVPRQSTKSTLAAEVLAWRLTHAGLFGERQIVVHTANKLQAAVRIQEDMHSWAAGAGLKVTRRTGQERITAPDSSRWEITSLQAAYGARPGMAFVDECFDVSLADVQKALLPAQSRRLSPQTWLVSTANESASDLMPFYMGEAMRGSDRVCCLLWGLHWSDDVSDEGLWAGACPAVSPEWLAEVRAQRGAEDWAGQWLNVWPRPSGRVDPRWVDPGVWDGLVGDVGVPVGPSVVAVDSDLRGERFSVVQGWLDEGGRVRVRVRVGLPRLVEALQLVDSWAPDALVVGVGWLKSVAVERQPQGYGRRETVMATGLLRDRVVSGGLVHEGDEVLSRQFGQVRLRVSEAGSSIGSKDSGVDVSGVKLVAWVVLALTRTDRPIAVPKAQIF